MDLSKAFDSIDHSMILAKLFSDGFDCHSVFCFASYLRYRPQVVKLNSVISDKESLQCGVPQGSVLEPVLFVLYINEIPEIFAKYAQNSTVAEIMGGLGGNFPQFNKTRKFSLEVGNFEGGIVIDGGLASKVTHPEFDLTRLSLTSV